MSVLLPSLPRTVLVVDDDADSRFIFSMALENAGHDVLLAVDGAEAVRVAKFTVPDIVLLDIMMPRIDGIGAMHALRSVVATRYVPIIAVTALASPDDLAIITVAGFDEILLKPVQPHEIVDVVARHTGGRHSPTVIRDAFLGDIGLRGQGMSPQVE
jgi:CheY-like chemotaxis protein